jgi:hypothetical protein
MMISGATAQIGPWPPFTGFMIALQYDVGLAAPRSTYYRHPDSAIRDIW